MKHILKLKYGRCAFVAIVAVAATSCRMAETWAEEKADVVSPPENTRATEADIESFDKVWETVRDNHWETDYGGVDWDAAKVELRPKVEAAKTRDEVRAILEELIAKLKVSHFGIIPADAYDVMNESEDDDDKKGSGTGGEAGLEFRLREGKITVSRVEADSSAARAGVKAGWTIEQIGKRSHDELIEAATKASSHGPMRLDTTIGILGEKATRGAPGKTLKIKFKDQQGEIHEPTIELQKADGKMVKFGHLPKMRVTYETRDLEQDVTYFAFNLFFDPPNVMPAFREAVGKAKDTNGLVIDLRGNHGGIAGMTFGMASMFAEEAGKMGVMKMRKQEMTFPLIPQLEPYTGPVAVLIDECSISSAEILSDGLKEKKMARVFGTTTAGLALPSTVVKLPNGDALQYAFATYTNASGAILEGVGVIPDEKIAPNSEELSKDSDPVLTRAVDWILEQSK